MKSLKYASGRLVMAVVALAVSVVMCVGVCIAWFAANNKVSAGGISTSIKGDGFSLSVTYYKVTYNADDLAYYYGDEIEEMVELDSTFGNISNPTMVLVKLDYTIDSSSGDKAYVITAESSIAEIEFESVSATGASSSTESGTSTATEDDTTSSEDSASSSTESSATSAATYSTSLANAIKFKSVTISDTAITVGDDIGSFTAVKTDSETTDDETTDSETKTSVSDFISLSADRIELVNDITASGTGYIVIDYNTDVISAMYDYLLQVEQAGLTSSLSFTSGGFSFVLTESTN